MFEDTNKPPQPIEDIFSDTEVTPVPRPAAPGAPQPPSMMPPKPTFVPPPAPPGRGPVMSTHKPASNKGLILGIVIVVAIGVLGVGYWFGLKPWLENRNTTPLEEVDVVEPPAAPDIIPPANNQPPVTETQDTDGDRLNDAEEFTIGTDPNNPDTDNDGLFDGEEILIYQTNPLNSDTDGDGYLDGEEVRNNYDPNGPGRLLNLPDGELNFQELDNLLQELNEETT